MPQQYNGLESFHVPKQTELNWTEPRASDPDKEVKTETPLFSFHPSPLLLLEKMVINYEQ
jgi:hypothetical protein